MVKSFNEFMKTNESYNDIDKTVSHNVAGVAIYWNEKILLVHPTDASWQKSALGIPKGGIEVGEDPLDAAVRELYEETGIKIEPSKLNSEPLVAPFYNEDGSVTKQLIYFELKIDSPSEIGLTSHIVPKDQLQLEEVDWAGFVKIDDAYAKIHRAQMIILDRLR